MTNGRDVFMGLVRLLPEDRRQDAMDFWDIGEQEAALDVLVETLIDCRVPITEQARARISILMEVWGMWNGDSSPGELAACLSADEPDRPWRLVEGTERGKALEERLAVRIEPGHPLHGPALVAWFACRRCEDVLVRVHEKEPWGLSPNASQYAIVRSPRSVRSFATGFEALDALVGGCGTPMTSAR
jgi:hypothetical protein